MNEMEFHTPCERMRFEAMRDGTGSQADRLWREHARHCKDCQGALHIMDFLGKVEGETMELPSVATAQLVETARLKFSQENRIKERRLLLCRWLAWGACVASAVLLLLLGMQLNWVRERGVEFLAKASDPSLTSVEALEPTSCGGFLPLSSADSEEAVERILSPAEAVVRPEVLPGRSMDRAIRSSRDRVQQLMHSLEDQIDRDFTEY